MQEVDALSLICSELSIEPGQEWSSIESVWPILERMRSEGAVVVVKLDGERTQKPYTVLVSGEGLQGDWIRRDSDSLNTALSGVVIEYAERVWSLYVD